MTSLALQSHADGVILPVKAQPGSRRNELKEIQDGALKVAVTQAAEQGKANDAIRDLLVKALKLKRSQVELVSGQTSHQKRFLIRNITEPELRTRVDSVVKPA